MTVRLRVKDEGGGLCRHCKHGTKITGRRTSGGIVTRIKCSAFMDSFIVPIEVESCGAFQEFGSMSLYDMKEKAWLLLNERNKKVGFVHPSKLDRKERATLLEDVEDPDYGR